MKKIILLLTIVFATNMTHAEEILKLGIVPQQSATSLARIWVPLAKLLSEKTGKNIRFETAPTIPEFEKRVSNGEYDIVYLNPHHYVLFSKKLGLRAIARQANKGLQGIIVVARDSEISSLEMLNNAEIAFPAPGSFAATMLPQANLTQKHIPFTSAYVSSHDSVYENVAKGFFVAGGGIERTLSNLPKHYFDKLKIIWRSKNYTPHAFAVYPKMSQEDATSIQNTLISLNELDNGKKIFNDLGFSDGIRISVDSDWNDVRQLNIKELNP